MAGLKTELEVRIPNKVGMLAKTLAPLKEGGVNILAFTAFSEYAHGKVMLVTQNNPLAKEILKKAGLNVLEKEIVFAELPDRSGGLAEATNHLAQAQINIHASYGTAGPHGAYFVVFDTNDNKKASSILTQYYG